MAKMYFKDIVPPHDTLQDELENIKGGMSEEPICDSGCASGCAGGGDKGDKGEPDDPK